METFSVFNLDRRDSHLKIRKCNKPRETACMQNLNYTADTEMMAGFKLFKFASFILPTYLFIHYVIYTFQVLLRFVLFFPLLYIFPSAPACDILKFPYGIK